jgi:hypothetical protein
MKIRIVDVIYNIAVLLSFEGLNAFRELIPPNSFYMNFGIAEIQRCIFAF